MYMEDPGQKDWDEYVPRLELAINTAHNFEFGQSSFYLVHGWNARTQLDAMIPPVNNGNQEREAWKWRNKVCRDHERALCQAADIQEQLVKDRQTTQHSQAADRIRTTTRTVYTRGDQVWLYFDKVQPGLTRKLAHLWHGPFTVEEKVSDVVYKLRVNRNNERIFPMVHVSRLKLWHATALRPSDLIAGAVKIDLDEELLPEDSFEPNEDDGEYEVEAILDHKIFRKTRSGRMMREYLVKWKNYEETQWVNENDLSCGALLHEYDKTRQVNARQQGVITDDNDDQCL